MPHLLNINEAGQRQRLLIFVLSEQQTLMFLSWAPAEPIRFCSATK